MRGKQVLQIQYTAPALKNTPKNIQNRTNLKIELILG